MLPLPVRLTSTVARHWTQPRAMHTSHGCPSSLEVSNLYVYRPILTNQKDCNVRGARDSTAGGRARPVLLLVQ